MSGDIVRRNSMQSFLQELENSFLECNCLLNAIEPDGAVAMRVAKHRVPAVILHVDAQCLAAAHYVAEQIRHIRDQLKQKPTDAVDVVNAVDIGGL